MNEKSRIYIMTIVILLIGSTFLPRLFFIQVESKEYKLKADKLTPSDVGQLDFYLAAVDGELKRDDDAPTIGLLLCKERNKVVAEYAVRNKTSPIGIAEYKLSEELPENLGDNLPTIEEIEIQLANKRKDD